ncbi:MAG: IS3 family transposase, partial [Bacilli bacterium]|nr:IS3 family transposase [Bacilli bacterium]MBP5551689.1 IS3 family transposase [Bacilli bacterium]
KAIDDYIAYFNNERLACTLGYKSPIQYRTEWGY